MRVIPGLFVFSTLFLGASCSSGGPAAAAGPLRPGDLLAAPNQYLNRSVEVEIVDPLYGPSTPQALAAVEYGQVRIDMPDARGSELSLVPAGFRVGDPNRYKKKFNQVLTSPLRVKGDFLSDDEIAKSMHRPSYVIRVASWEPVAQEAPISVHSLTELQSDPARWDRKRIVYEGNFESRFEVSALDHEIWLSYEPNTEVVGKPNDPPGTSKIYRVRVTGRLFSKSGISYGHLGGYRFELVASKLEFLGPATAP